MQLLGEIRNRLLRPDERRPRVVAWKHTGYGPQGGPVYDSRRRRGRTGAEGPREREGPPAVG